MKYDWKDAGEEWSERWGSSAAQWSGAIWPRIRDCLPATTILEIGAGYGRWTHYLKGHCERLLIVDRAAECIEACRTRFAADRHITAYVNKGGSLSMLPNESIDFVFSFDVFVHLEREIVEEYLSELSCKLKIHGRGFIHHSNFGKYANSPEKRFPPPIRKFLTKLHILDKDHHRTPTMTAELFRTLCSQYKLHCLKQEIVNWRGRRLIDCFSWFERTGLKEQAPTRISRNPNFMREAALIRAKSRILKE